MTFALPTVLWLAVAPFALLILDVSIGAAGADWPRVRRLWAGPSGFSEASVTRARRRWLLWFGLTLVIVAAARPQWGKIEEKTFDQSREVLLALDLSRSMLAEDVKPSRLARAKLLIESLLDRLKGERVGLVLFSGTAFLQSPLSPDYEVLREFLPELGPDYLPEGGTDFDRLLATTLDSFSNEGGADRFLIVLSDGESQTTEWRSRIEKLNQRNIRVITLGVGTEQGAVMPAEGGGFVKDERGAVVLSRLQPQTLRDLARLTNGAYANAAAWVDLKALLDQTVERGKQGGFTKRSEVRMQERYQWFLAAGLLFLAWSYWREFPVQPRVRDLRNRAGTVAASCLALIAVLTTATETRAQPVHIATPDARADVTALPDLVKQLSAKPSLSASDAARFANATIDYGEQQRQTGKPIPPGVLQDGFASVDLGERTDRKAADWPELRRKLEDLAKPPEQQKQDKKNEQKKDDEKKDQQQQQQGGGQDQNQKDQQEKQDQQQQDKKDEEQQKRSGQKAFDNQPPGQNPQQSHEGKPEPQDDKDQQAGKNMQTIGGQQATDEELQKSPELAVPLQRLDKVKQQDSPAKLFQILQDEEPKPKGKKERDW